ncbi:MAG: ATP-binding protein [Alphaproteobacteria bacterium]|nr:ATP-binding protein [Alphaproteobacteria bacterium]
MALGSNQFDRGGDGVRAGALSPERAAKLELDQLVMVDAHLRPGIIGFPIIGLTICGVLWQWVPVELLAIWFGAVCAATIFDWSLHHQFRTRRPGPGKAKRWGRVLTGSQILFSVLWTAPPLLFWHYCNDLGHMFLVLVYACNMAGGAAISGPYPRFAATSIGSSAVVMILPTVAEGTPFYFGIAALCLFYTGFMIHMSRNVFFTARDMLLLREDRNELIEQLTAAKIESDKARQRAETASHAKSEFLANMSHELRTPLNAILGFSEIMKGEVFGPLGSPQYADYSRHINDSGQHLLGLINDVLDLAKIEAGRFVVRAVEIDLRDTIDTALKQFAVQAAQGNVTLKTEVDHGLPLLLADERAMRQILLNLVSNAVKFTPAGGSVTTFARRSPSGGMEVGVIDTGCGIDPADINTVFEAFGQGQHDVATREKGTGLGLPIVRGLVEAHGGQVKLDSTLGKGTTFTCQFPRERLTAPQPVPIRLATVI